MKKAFSFCRRTCLNAVCTGEPLRFLELEFPVSCVFLYLTAEGSLTLMRPQSPQTGIETNAGVRPLTRRNAETGALYERLPEVQAQVRDAIARKATGLVESARQNHESPAHIKDETLCYFIREWLREGKEAEASIMVEVLLRRHAGTIARRVRSVVDARHREDCQSEIVIELLARLLDVNSDRSDFAQVRFGLFFERLSNNMLHKFRKLQRGERQASSITASLDDGAEEVDIFDSLADERALSAEDAVVARNALAHLTDELREIFILRHFAGWQIESDSDAEPSISRHLNVTPRTVRNRLKRAEASLARWREAKKS